MHPLSFFFFLLCLVSFVAFQLLWMYGSWLLSCFIWFVCLVTMFPLFPLADHQHFLQTAEYILSRLTNYDLAKYKIISSDLNFGNCFCKSPILNPKPLDSVAPDLFASYGFQQLIDIPTRVTLVSVSLIDLICQNSNSTKTQLN